MRIIASPLSFSRVAALLLACGLGASAKGVEGIATQPFGTTADGVPVQLYTMTNAHGMKASVTNYGAIVVELTAPDRTGHFDDVVLGFSKLDTYLHGSPYFGAIVGRFGNRIANGRFTLDGKTYTLATNDHPGGTSCALHGGVKGFDKRVWKAEPVTRKNDQGVKLSLHSPDGEEGYPGNLDVTVTYWLTANNELKIDYSATTDKATPVNITHHGYFNLKGEGKGDILDHQVTLHASRFTPVDKGLIPTGKLQPVKGTPFDFTKPHTIGERVNTNDVQLLNGGGYDHNWVLDRKKTDGKKLTLAAEVQEPTTGRRMEVWTNEIGIQFYSGNFLDGHFTGKGGAPYIKRSGLCLETQHFPDSPNQKTFPTTILKPGQTYQSTTIYRFSAR